MKKVIMLLIIVSSYLFCYNPAEEVETNWLSDYSNEPADVRQREAEIAMRREAIKEIIADANNEGSQELDKEEKEIQEGRKEYLKSEEYQKNQNPNQNIFFIKDFEFDDDSLYCPPLQNQYKNGYGVLTESINLYTGDVTCSVYLKQQKATAALTAATSKKVFRKVVTKTFTNKKYKDRINVTVGEIPESLISKDAVLSAELFSAKLDAAKTNIKYTYQKADNLSGDVETFIDLSDAIDAAMTLNPNIIDLEKSLNQKSLVFKDGYYVSYQDIEIYETAQYVKDVLKDASKELNEKFDWLPIIFDDSNYEKSIQEQQSETVRLLDSSINSLLYFVLIYQGEFYTIFVTFSILVILYTVYHIGSFYIENIRNENSDTNGKYVYAKVVMVIASAIFLLTMLVREEIETFEVDEKIVTVDLNYAQTAAILLNETMNDTADLVAKGVIDSYINTLFAITSATVDNINSSAKDLLRHKKIKEINNKVVDQCLDIYNVDLLKKDYPQFYKNTQNFNLFIPEGIAQKDKLLSVYNTINMDGYVKNKASFEESGLSLNSCFNAMKDLQNISRKIDYLEVKINSFNDLSYQEAVYSQKEFLLNKLYSDYYKYGYISVGNINILESYKKIMELPSKKMDEWSNIFLNFDAEQLTAYVAENSVLMLSMGEPVQKFVSGAVKSLTDGAFGWIPFGIGSALSSASSGIAGYMASVIYVDYIDELIPALRGIFLWALSYFMFMLMFIAKFVMFWLIPFGVLYVVAVGSTDKSAKFVIKIVTTFIKPVIFIPILFITIFLLDFSHNFLYMGLDIMKYDLTFSGSIIETIGIGALISIAKIFIIVIEFLLAYLFCVNGTKTIIETFELSAKDISDVVTDGVASAIQNKMVR